MPALTNTGAGVTEEPPVVYSSVPVPAASMAGAALRKWALALNGALASRGIYAGHVAIGTWITGTPGAPAGAPLTEPGDIARLYWDLHTGSEAAEHLISA